MDATDRLVSHLVVHAILKGAASVGVDEGPLLASVGLERSQIANPDGFVGAPVEEALWAQLGQHALGPQLPLRAARALTRGQFRALEYAVRTSDNLRDGLARLVRFSTLLYGCPVLISRTDSGVWIGYASPHKAGSPAAKLAEPFTLASVLLLARDATGVELAPSHLVLTVGNDAVDAFEHFFGVRPEPGAEPGMRFSLEAAELRLSAADPVLCDVIECCLVRQERPPAETTAGKLQRVLRMLLPSGEPPLDAVCTQLGMSRRTLQQRLQEEDTSFQDELGKLRIGLAREYLAVPELTVPGIALLLGYAETSSFYRAFKRATGTTPARFRKEALRTQ